MSHSNDGIEGMADQTSSMEQRKRRIASLIRSGVQVMNPDHTYVDETVRVAPDVTLLPGTHLRGSTVIAAGCCIGPDSWVEDSLVEAGSVVRYSVLEGARVRSGTIVGPYTHLRPGSDVGPDARIGNFVEIKQSRLGRGVKAAHLAYIGDADVGAGVNIGAGAVTCNYDGKTKHRSVIEAGAFVGANSSLVAPVVIGQDAVVAAGSVITCDVPPNTTAFGRARQVNKERGDKREETAADDE